MRRPDSEKYVVRDKELFVRHPFIHVDPEGDIVTEMVDIKADPFEQRKFNDIQKGGPPSPESPQELAQNE